MSVASYYINYDESLTVHPVDYLVYHIINSDRRLREMNQGEAFLEDKYQASKENLVPRKEDKTQQKEWLDEL